MYILLISNCLLTLPRRRFKNVSDREAMARNPKHIRRSYRVQEVTPSSPLPLPLPLPLPGVRLPMALAATNSCVKATSSVWARQHQVARGRKHSRTGQDFPTTSLTDRTVPKRAALVGPCCASCAFSVGITSTVRQVVTNLSHQVMQNSPVFCPTPVIGKALLPGLV